jgi:hypothetical protein
MSDDDLLDLSFHLLNDPLQKVMGLGTGVFGSFHFRIHGVGFAGPDPDQKGAFLLKIREDDYRLVARRVDGQTLDFDWKQFWRCSRGGSRLPGR